MKNLLNFTYISLDIFRERIHNKGHQELTEQDAELAESKSENERLRKLLAQYESKEKA